MAQQTPWPALELEGCRDTLTTLQLYAQVIGKLQLALTPSQAGWANAPLRLTPRGIASKVLWPDERSLSIGFDLIVHQLRFELSDGTRRALLLEPRSVADFYAAVMTTLVELGVEVTIDPTSVETAAPVSLSADTGHGSYDRACVGELFQAWTRVAAVFDRFRSGYCGRQTPVDLWWGTFDLSVVRYSGRAASPPFDSGAIERAAMEAEQSLVGFWPGDDASPAPVFFSYIYPKPAGIEAATVTPPGAQWSAEAGEFIVSYDTIRRSADPARALLGFCESTYGAGSRLAGWDRATLDRRPTADRIA